MKKSIFVALFAIVTITSFATVRTVSNSPFGGAQYSTLLAAYNAASNGDTLHVEGTNVTYTMPGTWWAKSLTVIGIGFNANKQNPGKTYFQYANGVGNQFNLLAGGSGSKFYGIIFTALVSLGGASNILFANCFFYNSVNLLGVSTNGITIRNSIFSFVNGNCFEIGNNTAVVSGVSISNCVFNGYISGQNNPTVSMNVDHCLFLGGNSIFQLQNATISNNIFMNSFIAANNSNCTFLNNICNVPGTFPPAGSGNIASGNIANTNPNMVNYTLNNFYLLTHNYNLQVGSPAIGAGSDATDIGVHGGTSMFFSEQGEVLINPIMREVSILNPTVTPGGTLNVKIIATKPKDN